MAAPNTPARDRPGSERGQLHLPCGHGLRCVPGPLRIQIQNENVPASRAEGFFLQALKLCDQPAGALFGVIEQKRPFKTRDGEKENDAHQGHDHDELEQGETAPAAPDHSVSQLLMSLFSFSPPGTPSAP